MTAPIKPYKDKLFCRLVGELELCSYRQGYECWGCMKYLECEKLWDKISEMASWRRVNRQDLGNYLALLKQVLNDNGGQRKEAKI